MFQHACHLGRPVRVFLVIPPDDLSHIVIVYGYPNLYYEVIPGTVPSVAFGIVLNVWTNPRVAAVDAMLGSLSLCSGMQWPGSLQCVQTSRHFPCVQCIVASPSQPLGRVVQA